MGVAISIWFDNDDDWDAGAVREDASNSALQKAPATAAARQQVSGTLALSRGPALSPYPEVDWMKDWIGMHIFQFFSDIEGFHLGDLDLAGRHPGRYLQLKRTWDAYLIDFERLAPYVSLADVDRAHFDMVAREWVYEVHHAEGVAHRKLWNAFCRKWKFAGVRYEDLAALTERARGIVAAHPQPKCQETSLDDMPPEIIHSIFSHLSKQYKEGQNLAATSKFFHEIGCSHIFKFRNIVFGADKFLQKIDARKPESTLAEVRAKMAVDRDTLLDHMAFLASRPDICRRIRRLRVANNWANPTLVGPGADDMCRRHLEDAVFDPVRRALSDLLAHVSLSRLDLEFVSLDEGLVRGICAQEHLDEVNLKGCVMSPIVRDFCLGETSMPQPGPPRAPPARSKIRYLGLTYVRFPPASSIWDFLALCPDLLSLQATGASQRRGFGLPSLPRITALCSILQFLERLELYPISSLELATVSTWLHSADHPFRLNHVKLISDFGILDDQATLLLRSLHRGRPPLRTLMLDGLALRSSDDAALPVMDLIAELFPGLEGLALAHRASGMYDSRPCPWPRPMHTYAPPLRAFTRLRTFGANFDLWNLGVSTSLRETLYPVGVPGEVYQRRQCDPGDPEDSQELLNHVLAAPFAAACPSLRYFVATGAWSTPLYCVRIGRTEAGVMNMEDTMPCDPDAPEVLRLYNPACLVRYD